MLRMLQVANLIGLASCGVGLFVAWPAGLLTGFEKVAIPALSACFVVLLTVIHLTGVRHLVPAGHTFFLASAAFLVLSLANALFFQAEPALATIYAFWMPVLYIFGTAILGAKRSQRICWATFAAVTAIYVAWFALGRAGAGELALPMEIVIAESLITQAAALGCLYVLAVFRERNAAAQARATTLEEHAAELEAAVAEANEARAEAEAASHSRALFVATMNHELRTPLNAIMGFAEMIRDRGLGDGAIDTYSEYAGYIHRSGLSLRTLVEDILEFARIDANKMKIEPEPYDLAPIVRDVAAMMEPAVRDAGLTLNVACEDGVPLALADRRATRLILVNLVSNALRHTPAGGTIAIGLRADDLGRPSLNVEDDGSGLSARSRETLFTPFAFTGSIEVAQEGGSGIGFYVVKALVDEHEGQIEVESEPGEGTKVTITFPRADAG